MLIRIDNILQYIEESNNTSFALNYAEQDGYIYIKGLEYPYWCHISLRIQIDNLIEVYNKRWHFQNLIHKKDLIEYLKTNRSYWYKD